MDAQSIKYYNYLWFDSNLFSEVKKKDSFVQINNKFRTLIKYINSFHFQALSEYINSNDIQDKIYSLNLPIIIIYSKDLKDNVIVYFRKIKGVKAYICYSQNSNDIELLKSFSSEKYLKTASCLEELENHLLDLVIKEYSRDYLQVNEMNILHFELLNEDRNVNEDFKLRSYSFEKMLFVGNKIDYSDPHSFYIYNKTVFESDENNIHICSPIKIDENMIISNTESLWDYYFFEKELCRTKIDYCPDDNFIFFKDNIIKSLCNKDIINRDIEFIFDNYISKLQSVFNTQELCKKLLSLYLLRDKENNIGKIIFNKLISNSLKGFKLELMEKLKHILMAIFLNFHKSYSTRKNLNGKAYKYLNLSEFDCLEPGKILFFNQFLTTNHEKINSSDKEMENWVYKNKNTKLEIELDSCEDISYYNNYIDISEYLKTNKPKEKVILFAPFTSFLIRRIEVNPINSKRIITLSILPINNFMNFNLSYPYKNIYNDKLCQIKIVEIIKYLNSVQVINEACQGNPYDYYIKLNQAIGKLKADCGNYSEAISFYSKALEIKGNNFNYDSEEFLIYVEIGYCFLDNDQYDLAFKYFKSAEDTINNGGLDKIHYVKLYQCLMDYYEHINDKKKTIEFMKMFLETKIFFEGKYSPNIASNYIKISKYIVYNGEENDYEYSLDLLFRCKKIFKGKNEELGKIYIKIAKIYTKFKMYDQAIEYLMSSKECFSKLGENNRNIAKALYNICIIYFILYKQDLALKIFLLANNISKENKQSKRNIPNCESKAFININEIYLKKLLENKNGIDEKILNEAISHNEYFLKVLKKSCKPIPTNLSYVYKELSKLYGYKQDLSKEKYYLEQALIVEKGINEYSSEVYRLYIELTKVLEKMTDFPNKLNDLEQCYSNIIEISSSYMNDNQIKNELERLHFNLATTLFSLKKFAKAKVYFIEYERLITIKGNSNNLNHCRILKYIGLCFFEENNMIEAERYLKHSEELLNKFSYKFFTEFVEVLLYQAKIKIFRKNYDESLKILNEALKNEKLEVKRVPIYECFLEIYKCLNKPTQIIEIEIKICEIKIALSNELNTEILNYYESFFKHYKTVLDSFEKNRKSLNEKDKLYYIEYKFRHLLLEMKLNLKALTDAKNKVKNKANEMNDLYNFYNQYEDSRTDILYYREKLQEKCNMFIFQINGYVSYVVTDYKHIISSNSKKNITEAYLRARKYFFRSLQDFFFVSLFSVEDVQLLKFINELTSNKEIKAVEDKGPFISSSIIIQLIKAETLCNIGISDNTTPRYFKEGIDAYTKIINNYVLNIDLFKSKIYKRIAAVYKKRGEFNIYREYLEKIKSIFLDDYSNNILKIIDLNIDIAISNLCCKSYHDSVLYLEQAMGIFSDNRYQDEMKIADIQKLMGVNYSKLGNLEEALDCYHRSLDILKSRKIDDEDEEIYSLFYLICVIHVKKHDYFVSLEYLKKARGVIYLKKESVLKTQIIEFLGCYKKYLDFVDENIWINFNWDNEKIRN